MRRRFRVGSHELDIAVDRPRETDRPELEEPPAGGKVLFSRTWDFDETSPAEDTLRSESDEEKSVDIVRRDPLRLRNVLLIPSAVVVLLLPFKGFVGDEGWYWALLVTGLAGIGAWEALRRWERSL